MMTRAQKLFISNAVMAVCAALASVVYAGPSIKWDTIRHDFGAFNEDLATVSCNFHGINDGDETLVIYDVRPNCGCTTTDRYAGRTYEPGDSIDIRVTYNAIGRPGRFSKKVMVHSNAMPEKQNLTISGTVIAASNTLQSRFPVDAGKFKIHSSTVMLGEVYKGGAAGAYFKAYNPGPDTIRPVVVTKPDYMDVTIKPRVITPGEQFVISISLLSGKCPEWGIVTDTITLRPDNRSDSVISLYTVVTIKEDFRNLSERQLEAAPHISVDPPVIDLGRISRSADPVNYSLKISNTGKSPLVIRRIYSPDPAVKVEAISTTRVSQGKHATVRLTVDQALSADSDMINARLTIISNDPDHPNTVVRIVGEITD